MIKIICPKCNNSSKNYFAKRGDGIYCRKCLAFIGKKADHSYSAKKGGYNLEYPLTDNQREASKFILDNVVKNKNCALNAVCGAGKTEIIYETIEYCLNHNYKIGIAIPRKDVVIELKERLDKNFNVSVISVYGGNKDVLEGDIIVFTTHQAFRYINYFDVLIIDEVDAFPFKNNEVLQSVVHKCSKVFVYLSATMPEYIENDREINKYYLNERYHGFKIPVPKCKLCLSFIYCLKKSLKKYKNKVVLVYFPTIKVQKKVAKKIKCDFLVNSSSNNRDGLLNKIKNLEKGVVFTTTILERGITIKDVQVIVYNAEHELFNYDTLIQISGRVGRNKDYPNGDVILICKNKTKKIKRAIRIIKRSNA